MQICGRKYVDQNTYLFKNVMQSTHHHESLYKCCNQYYDMALFLHVFISYIYYLHSLFCIHHFIVIYSSEVLNVFFYFQVFNIPVDTMFGNVFTDNEFNETFNDMCKMKGNYMTYINIYNYIGLCYINVYCIYILVYIFRFFNN